MKYSREFGSNVLVPRTAFVLFQDLIKTFVIGVTFEFVRFGRSQASIALRSARSGRFGSAIK